jgi:mono/diheme cytochrome c family protein
MTGRFLLNSVLLALMLLNALAVTGMRRDHTRPNFSFMREMVDSVPYDAFSASPVFPDGRTLRQAIPGTVSRAMLPLHYAATPEDAERAAAELESPYAQLSPTPESQAPIQTAIQAGADAYRVNCIPCHGVSGAGDGPVALRGYPPPPPFTAEHAVQMSDGQMFHVITYGQGNMAGYAGQVSREDRWNIILYIRSLQQAAAPAQNPQADVPDRGNLE